MHIADNEKFYELTDTVDGLKFGIGTNIHLTQSMYLTKREVIQLAMDLLFSLREMK
jgi:hypothetical protein